MNKDEVKLEIITKLISLLREKGWATDDDLDIARCLAVQPKLLEKLARKHGYLGGSIGVMGDYHPLSGDIYVLYDIDKINVEQAQYITKRTAASVLANVLSESD